MRSHDDASRADLAGDGEDGLHRLPVADDDLGAPALGQPLELALRVAA
jgi:hypothetical protein